MTTQQDDTTEQKAKYNFNEKENQHEWDVPAHEDEKDLPLLSAEKINSVIDILLKPYKPAESEKEADKYFSTNEIIAAIERHYGVPQGDPTFNTPDAGLKVVNKMIQLGFTYVNRGNMELEWIMKKR